MKKRAFAVSVTALLLLSACASGPGRTPLPPSPPKGEPGEVIGMAASQLRVAFGVPAFTRRENGSELWRYDSPNCRAFFFLYQAGREMAVRHVETVPAGRKTGADPACLAAIRAKPATS